MDHLNNQNPKSPSLSLPPGFRFHPTEQQILSFYLSNKNNNNQNPNLILSSSTTTTSPFLCLDVISEIDLYNYHPYELPEIDSFPYGYAGTKKHWYYFTLNRKGSKRKSKGGFWKSKCRTVNVLGGGEGNLLGTKTSFVFYRRDSSSRRCCRTNWIMIEYALVDHQMDFFVLCRVFLKTCSVNKLIDVGLNSHNKDVFTAKGNSFIDVPYRQLDRDSVLGIGEVVVHEDANYNDAVQLQRQSTAELNNQATVGSLSDDGIGTSLGVLQSDLLVSISNGFIGTTGATFDNVVADELSFNTIFLEGDYLELDDLVGPLCDFGSSG